MGIFFPELTQLHFLGHFQSVSSGYRKGKNNRNLSEVFPYKGKNKDMFDSCF